MEAKIINYLENLLKLPSPTGFTHLTQTYIMDALKTLGFEPIQLRKGAVLVKVGGCGEGLLLSAHMDTLGAIVRSIKPNGRLRLSKLGSYPEATIESENCTVFTRTGESYSGTVQLINPAVHVNHDIGEMKRNDERIELVLDECVSNIEEVQKLNISAGDFVAFDPRTRILDNGFIKSRYLDDKASCSVLLALAEWIQSNKITLKHTVYLYFTTYEEVGHGGAAGIPNDVTRMIAVDMGAVGDDLLTDEFKVSICAKDSSGPFDYHLTSELIALAKANQIAYEVDIYPYYSSDASAMLNAGYDIAHALIGPGISASHGYERAHISGLMNTLKLLQRYISE